MITVIAGCFLGGLDEEELQRTFGAHFADGCLLRAEPWPEKTRPPPACVFWERSTALRAPPSDCAGLASAGWTARSGRLLHAANMSIVAGSGPGRLMG